MIELFLSADELGNEIIGFNDVTIENPKKGSATVTGDVISWENKIVERTFLDGAVELGDKRIESRRLILSYDKAIEDDNDLRSTENELLQALKIGKYLLDKTNEIQIRVAALNYNILYDSGTYRNTGKITIEFMCLNPFWEDINENTSAQGTALAAATTEVIFNTNSNLPVYPIIELSSALLTPGFDVEIWVEETQEGILINDTILGTGNYQKMIINCNLGTVIVGGPGEDDIDITTSISKNTGFFGLPNNIDGSDITVNIKPSQEVNYAIGFFERTYI